jgi:LysM repeat protein
MDQRTRRSPARFLAPLALIAVLVAFMAIVSGSGGGGTTTTTDQSSNTTASQTSSSATKTGSKTKKKPVKDSKKTYTIQAGDTLGGIAAKTGVPLSRIEELNPSVDPHAMTTGQEIRLK